MNIDSIFSVTANDFEEKALAVFAYQFAHVPFYQTYCKLMHKQPENVRTINDIPFLPIEFFKTQQIIAEGKEAQAIASMFTGLTIAILAMVPFVTFLGHHLHWRFAFGVVSFLGLLTILFLY